MDGAPQLLNPPPGTKTPALAHAWHPPLRQTARRARGHPAIHLRQPPQTSRHVPRIAPSSLCPNPDYTRPTLPQPPRRKTSAQPPAPPSLVQLNTLKRLLIASTPRADIRQSRHASDQSHTSAHFLRQRHRATSPSRNRIHPANFPPAATKIPINPT